MTLYLKYRPQTIDELDLESVRDSIRSIVLSGNIPHAFLFSGPKGTGKTSAARILAKIVNCTSLGKDGEPCNKCEMCLSITRGNNIDIIELDAASNRGIDDIRSLKEGIYLMPVKAAKKVYIIDEAHMLTIEAANAFLKTLEEPPAHAVFILATTNPEKLPQTVISRLTQVNFMRATSKDISRQLERVAKGEKIKIERDAILSIAKLSDGSFRDAVKIFENLSFKTKDVKLSDVESIFSSSDSKVNEFFKILHDKDSKQSLEFIENLVKNGVAIRNFINEILESIHKSILAKTGLGEDNLRDFKLEELINLNGLIGDARGQTSPILQLPFEIAVLKFCGPIEPKETKKKENKKVTVKSLDDELWQKILQKAREKNISMEALLRGATPIDFDGKNLKLGVYYQFHKDKLEDTKNRRILEDICEEIFNIDSIKITFELIERQKQVRKEERSLSTNVDKDIIDAAKEIFG